MKGSKIVIWVDFNSKCRSVLLKNFHSSLGVGFASIILTVCPRNESGRIDPVWTEQLVFYPFITSLFQVCELPFGATWGVSCRCRKRTRWQDHSQAVCECSEGMWDFLIDCVMISPGLCSVRYCFDSHTWPILQLLITALDSNTEEIMTLNSNFLVFEIHLLSYMFK